MKTTEEEIATSRETLASLEKLLTWVEYYVRVGHVEAENDCREAREILEKAKGAQS